MDRLENICSCLMCREKLAKKQLEKIKKDLEEINAEWNLHKRIV